MESPNFAPHFNNHSDASRPSLGFPLGTALLLIVVFSLSGVFSCCYHWDKFAFFRRSSHPQDLEAAIHHAPTNLKPTHINVKQIEQQSMGVIMPGDEVPKFIAMPCPCQPPRVGNSNNIIADEVQKSTKPQPAEVPLFINPPPIQPFFL